MLNKTKKIGLIQFPIQLNVFSITDVKSQTFGDFILEPNYKELYLNLINEFEYLYKNKSITLKELSLKLANKKQEEIEQILKDLL